MSSLLVPRVNIATGKFNYFQMQNSLVDLPWHSISQVNWPQSYPYKPLVNFQIAHDDETLYVHFAVEEEFIKAQYIRPNEAVWEDSCVEFFISFDRKQTYYNLEFNVLGTGLIGYGSSIKSQRKRLSSQEIERVKTATSVVSAQGRKTWSTIWAVPVATFQAAKITSFAQLKGHCNLYKCGDELPNAHFVSWNQIDNPTPNFHLPNFFGEINFE
ncbi:MAG: carbohydrate-binding family 9-like protein [Sphingobacterium sp.]|uniref:carbohydrate-binding family 9-like protein n=1 Tax=Sphingobacterium sp. JB170 TaxID=1434842 RepID=UPI00097ECCEB|nr:carbohydrate-binding family 9-like protein [Sphingobacterium sp. JB170]SJN38659.1 hypothetical protein FM107_09725 [Sphingobacterium sp. JB170]